MIICSILMIITLVAIMIFKVQHNNALCNSLLNLNLNKDICNGVIRDFSNPTTISLGTIKNNIQYFKKYNYFINYFIYFFLSYIPIILLCFFKNNQKIGYRICYTSNFFSCFFSSNNFSNIRLGKIYKCFVNFKYNLSTFFFKKFTN